MGSGLPFVRGQRPQDCPPPAAHGSALSLDLSSCRLVKLSWFDDDAFRATPDDAAALLARSRGAGDAAAYAAGLRLLAGLVAEFNAPTPGRTLTLHRKARVGLGGLMAGAGGTWTRSAVIVSSHSQ